MTKQPTKITVIGAGTIGSTVAYTLMTKQLAQEIRIVNRNQIKAQAKATDISHCAPFTGGIQIRHGDFPDASDSDIVVVTAGVLPSENGTRMDVLASNIEIYKEIIPQIAKYSPNAIIIIITNPVDVMAYTAYKLSGFPPERIIGSGTLLDTIRFKYMLGNQFNINPANIEAEIIGEHGESMVPVWSRVRFGETELSLDIETKAKILQETKRAGWNIRLANEHSCYAISLSVIKIIETILGISQEAIPVSTLMQGDYGLKDVFLSLPTLLDEKGVRSRENIPLKQDELEQLVKSAEVLDKYTREADRLLSK